MTITKYGTTGPQGLGVPVYNEGNHSPMIDARYLKQDKMRQVTFKCPRDLVARLTSHGINVSMVCRDALMRIDLELRSGGLIGEQRPTAKAKVKRAKKS